MADYTPKSQRSTSGGLGLGLGLGQSGGLGLGLGSSKGLGLGLGLGLGSGLGLGNGLGLGLGNGLGLGLGNGLGLGSGLGLGDTPYPAGAIPVGADGGIGLVRSYYATPIELALLPWTLNFTPDNRGSQPFPLDYTINPYQPGMAPLQWITEDWDPALRFWALPFDPNLGEWLQAADRSEPGTLAALEFAAEHARWLVSEEDLKDVKGWLDAEDVNWIPELYSGPLDGQTPEQKAFEFIKGELEQLRQYMEDDRQSYLLECDVQADGLPAYMIHFLGINSFDHPHTLQLLDVCLAVGNVAYMSYKALFKRVRPSILKPGLTVPFGPPAHPAFPSGHSFLAHLISLILLEIPGLYQRFGVLDSGSPGDGDLLRKPELGDLNGRDPIPSPLLTVAQRIAVNRERIGVHYPSDSYGSRHLAAGIWDAIFNEADETKKITCPTLKRAVEHAKSEWPTPWPA